MPPRGGQDGGGFGGGGGRGGLGFNGGGGGGMSRHEEQENKKARTCYIGGVNPDMTDDILREFFDTKIGKVPDREASGPSVDKIMANRNSNFAFIEFFNKCDADIAVCLDGTKIVGKSVSVRRPKGYTAPPGTKKYSIPGIIASHVPDGPGKIFMGGLPNHLTEQQVQSMAEAFGVLEAFTLVKDRNTGTSKGYGFFSFVDKNVTDMCCEALNGKEIGGKTIACKRANLKNSQPNQPSSVLSSAYPPPAAGGTPSYGAPNPYSAAAPTPGGSQIHPSRMAMMNPGGARQAPQPPQMPQMPHMPHMPGMPAPPQMPPMPPQYPGMPPNPAAANGAMPTATLLLQNMLTPDELQDQKEYVEITEDIREECGSYGQIVRMFIPRPPHAEAGNIFLEYTHPSGSAAAMASLQGRKFSNRAIVAKYLEPHMWPRPY